MKNAYYSLKNRETPVLTSEGTAQEWDQDQVDIRARWQDLRFYERILKERAVYPNWPVSVLIEGGSGHFDCTERMAKYYAVYIDRAAKARLSSDGRPALKQVQLETGWLADLPVPGHEGHPALAAAGTAPASQALPWYFDEAMAHEAQAMAAINWKADSQLPVFVDGNGVMAPFSYKGIAGDVPYITGADGVTFRLSGALVAQDPPDVQECRGAFWLRRPSARSRMDLRPHSTRRKGHFSHRAGPDVAAAGVSGGPAPRKPCRARCRATGVRQAEGKQRREAANHYVRQDRRRRLRQPSTSSFPRQRTRGCP